jgi:hypothetical protein
MLYLQWLIKVNYRNRIITYKTTSESEIEKHVTPNPCCDAFFIIILIPIEPSSVVGNFNGWINFVNTK